jgi:hypothetical protein
MAIAYENNSSADYIDFVSKLRTFLSSNGWTVTTAGNSGWGAASSFVASRGLCHVYFGTDEYEETNYYVDATRQFVDVPRFEMGLGDSAPADPALIEKFSDMPGQGDVVSAFRSCMALGQTNGQYSNYHFFDDPVANTFTGVCEALGERYWQFGFGELQKNGLTHGGATYCTATFNRDYLTGTTSRAIGNNPFQEEFFGCGRQWAETSTSYGGGGNTQICVPSDGLPVGSGYPEGSGGRMILSRDSVVAIINSRNWGPTYRSAYGQWNHFTVGTASEIAGVMPAGGMTPLGAFPIFVGSSGGKMCYLGDIPNARVCNVAHLPAGAELNYGGEVWKVFPRYIKTDDSLIDQPFTRTSGNLGFAVRRS